MSRSINDLMPEVRIMCAGCPDMLVTYALSQSLSEFLDRAEVWKEWSEVLNTYAGTYTTDGTTSWPNHTGSLNRIDVRIKRLDKLRWTTDGEEIPFRTTDQLQAIDPLWDTRTGTRPIYYTNDGEDPAVAEVSVSKFRIRVYPYAAANNTPGTFSARFVLVTNPIANIGINEYDTQHAEIPDRIFYAFRKAIIAGALYRLLMVPGKDWSAPKLAGTYLVEFENAVAAAKSRADMDFGNAPLAVTYGGI